MTGPRHTAGDDVASFLRHARRLSHQGATALAAVSEAASLRTQSVARRQGLEAKYRERGVEALIEELLARDEELAAVADELSRHVAGLSHACVLLERERCKYVDLFARASDAYVSTDLRGVGQDANAAAEALLNVERGFLRGRPLIAFVARGDTHPFRLLLREIAIAEDGPARAFSLRMRPRGRPVFVADGSVSALRTGEGKRVALRWVLRDSADATIPGEAGSG
jgi:PAS domain-containing protein